MSLSVCGRAESAGHGDAGHLPAVAGGGGGLLPGQLHPEPALVGTGPPHVAVAACARLLQPPF